MPAPVVERIGPESSLGLRVLDATFDRTGVPLLLCEDGDGTVIHRAVLDEVERVEPPHDGRWERIVALRDAIALVGSARRSAGGNRQPVKFLGSGAQFEIPAGNVVPVGNGIAVAYGDESLYGGDEVAQLGLVWFSSRGEVRFGFAADIEGFGFDLGFDVVAPVDDTRCAVIEPASNRLLIIDVEKCRVQDWEIGRRLSWWCLGVNAIKSRGLLVGQGIDGFSSRVYGADLSDKKLTLSDLGAYSFSRSHGDHEGRIVAMHDGLPYVVT